MPARALAVLLVENEPDGAESLAELLMLLGHEVRVARSGGEALAAWADAPADVVILDADLPGGDGYAVARQLCAGSRRHPLLVMHTGFSGLDSRSREEGFDHHLVKPVDPQVWTDLLGAHAARLAAQPPDPPA